MERRLFLTAAALAASAALGFSAGGPAQAADTVKLGLVAEFSGAGAPSGTNWRDGVKLATKEINAAGGILGKQIELLEYDTQTDPQTSRALVQKAIDEDAYVILGTVYSGSTIVNMLVAQQNGVPQICGSEAPAITQKGNPYIFRASSGAEKGIPALTAYFRDTLKAKKVAVQWINNEFGKGGHDVFLAQMKGAGIEVVSDVSSEQGQADYAADVSKLKQSGADAAFVYLNEEESGRFLREANKQGIKMPLVGEVVLTSQKVIDLAGPAANGALAHVGLTPDAPIPAFEEYGKKFQDAYGRKTDHNGIKGYIATYAVKYVTEMIGKVDREAFAQKMHGLCLKAAEYPGMLLDTCWDDTGEMSRPSFMTQVKDGKQVVIGTVPAN